MIVLLKFNGVKIYLFLWSLTLYLFPVKMIGKPNVGPGKWSFWPYIVCWHLESTCCESKSQWTMSSCVRAGWMLMILNQNFNTNVSFGAQCWFKEGIGAWAVCQNLVLILTFSPSNSTFRIVWGESRLFLEWILHATSKQVHVV